MDRLFLDANVLFSAAYSPRSKLNRLWQLRNVILCSSHYALEEARVNLGDESQRARLLQLANQIEFTDPAGRPLPTGVVLPEKDAPILIAAIDSRATHLLTGDMRHFGMYFGRQIEGVLILRVGEYLKKLS